MDSCIDVVYWTETIELDINYLRCIGDIRTRGWRRLLLARSVGESGVCCATILGIIQEIH